tara:strand:- start:344 stop:490 length:147 start_codon:yes stop_codon:yes gene_type:complete
VAIVPTIGLLTTIRLLPRPLDLFRKSNIRHNLPPISGGYRTNSLLWLQ